MSSDLLINYKHKVVVRVFRITTTKHLQNIYTEEELDKEATSAKFAQVQKEGERDVKRNIDFYNLDAIISVGYRVYSTKATQFRIWATKTLKEYIVSMHTSALLISSTKLLKNLVIWSKVLYICTSNATRAFCISCKSAFFLDCYLTKDNTPSRLTSVAHLGGLLFYKPLVL